MRERKAGHWREGDGEKKRGWERWGEVERGRGKTTTTNSCGLVPVTVQRRVVEGVEGEEHLVGRRIPKHKP